MARGRTERVMVTTVNEGTARRRPDDVIVEEPLAIRLDSVEVATTMRTPGHDFELAAGWCHADGLLVDDQDRTVAIIGIRYCATGSAVDTGFNVVSVDTGGRSRPATPRLAAISSSCGWCGSDELDARIEGVTPLESQPPIPLEVIASIPERVSSHQRLFERTGGVHAAAVFGPDGDIDMVREDVGRHNAVDKVVGALLLAGDLPATGLGLFVSGRASVELVHKAWTAGFGTVVAVSAPTALAVATARRANMTLAGFARGDSINIYAPERVERP